MWPMGSRCSARWRRSVGVAGLAVLVAGFLSGCTLVRRGGAEPPPTVIGQPGGRGCAQGDQTPEQMSGELAILAGSELKDLDEERDGTGKSIVDHIRDATGVSVRFTY